MAKVLFIRPPQIRWLNETKRLSQPLGLLSIMGLLRKHGHDVYLCDASAEGFNNETEIKPNVWRYGLSTEEIERRISIIQPHVVGINCTFTMYWNEVKYVAEIVKRVTPNAIVIIGGQHASGAYKEILSFNQENIDFIILGEGEIPTLILVNLLEKYKFNKTKLNTKISEVAYKIENQIIWSPGNFIKDLDSLPDPAFDLLDPTIYTATMSHYCKPKGRNFFTYLNQRGCNIGCYFCTTPYYWGKRVRINSLKRIEAHIRSIRSLGFEEFVFQDDNILLWDKTIREKYLQFVSEAGFYSFNDAGYYYPLIEQYHIDELKNAGVYGIFLPVENPNLDKMHEQRKYLQIISEKQMIKKLEKVTRWLNNAGIRFYSAIMVGFPGETFQDLKKAVDFAKFIKTLGAFCMTFNFVHPYPGTPLYRDYYSLVPEERKWEKYPEYYNFIKPVFPLKDISLEDAEKFINEKFQEINGISIRNPSYLWD